MMGPDQVRIQLFHKDRLERNFEYNLYVRLALLGERIAAITTRLCLTEQRKKSTHERYTQLIREGKATRRLWKC